MDSQYDNFCDEPITVLIGPDPEPEVYEVNERRPLLRLMDNDLGATLIGVASIFGAVGLLGLFGYAVGL